MSGAVSNSGGSCESVARLLGAHVDGQLDAATTVEVDDHLAECETCRERVALDRAIRGSLKRGVKTSAPSDMRARMLAAMTQPEAPAEAALGLAEPPSTRPAMLRHWRTMIPVASAAALAIAWGFAGQQPLARNDSASRVGAGLDNDNLLVNQLVEMHSRPIRPETPDPKEVRAFEREVGVPVHPPQLEKNARFGGGRLLPVQGGERAAMLQYEVAQNNGAIQRVSVFVYDPRKVHIRGVDQVAPRPYGTAQVRVAQARGYSVAVAENGSVGYAVVSDVEDASAQYALAAYRE